ncbi:sporulation integral membrane protein YtvI [Rubeoparvulum massiliense]|uniref:sporulation integral membrane protein YtvI n=1 Tax=Rubeoparvulum massiliense TaxID=1631346 RepID=UPI00065DD097|nr:sporulation integral membrane protein YtvI [Rubeoparvulum massiliense]
MYQFYKKYWKTGFDIGVIVLTVWLIMVTFTFLFNIAKPIFYCLVIYMIIEPMARFFQRRGMKKIIATSLSVLLFALIILSILAGFIAIFINEMAQLAQVIPGYIHTFQSELINLISRFEFMRSWIPEDFLMNWQQYVGDVLQKANQYVGEGMKAIGDRITSVSSFVINMGFGVILAFFLSIESDMWQRWAREKTPNTFKRAYYFLKNNVIRGILAYIKSVLKLISISFILVFIGMLILGVRSAFTIALLAAFLDLLPLLGVSTLFIPWIIYEFVVNNISFAISLSVVYLVVVLTRNFLEPKITGDSLGVSAFTMLAFMVVSITLFGVPGLIISPILVILIKELIAQGYFKKWIRLPEDEFTPMEVEKKPE